MKNTELIVKSREAMMEAVQIYNNPQIRYFHMNGWIPVIEKHCQELQANMDCQTERVYYPKDIVERIFFAIRSRILRKKCCTFEIEENVWR